VWHDKKVTNRRKNFEKRISVLKIKRIQLIGVSYKKVTELFGTVEFRRNGFGWRVWGRGRVIDSGGFGL